MAAAPSVPKDSYQTRTQAEELGKSKQWLPARPAETQLGLASAIGASWFSSLSRVPARRAQAPQRCRGYLQSISASARHGEWHSVCCQQGPGGWGRQAKPEPLEMLPFAFFLKPSLDMSLVPSFKAGVLLLLLPPTFSECFSQAPRPHEVTPAESHTGSLHDRVWGEGALMSSCCSRFVGQASPTSGDSPSGCFHSTWWRSLLERRGLPDTLTGDGPGAATSAVSSKRRFSPSTLSFHFPSFAMCATPRAGEGGK